MVHYVGVFGLLALLAAITLSQPGEPHGISGASIELLAKLICVASVVAVIGRALLSGERTALGAFKLQRAEANKSRYCTGEVSSPSSSKLIRRSRKIDSRVRDLGDDVGEISSRIERLESGIVDLAKLVNKLLVETEVNNTKDGEQPESLQSILSDLRRELRDHWDLQIKDGQEIFKAIGKLQSDPGSRFSKHDAHALNRQYDTIQRRLDNLGERLDNLGSCFANSSGTGQSFLVENLKTLTTSVDQTLAATEQIGTIPSLVTETVQSEIRKFGAALVSELQGLGKKIDGSRDESSVRRFDYGQGQDAEWKRWCEAIEGVLGLDEAQVGEAISRWGRETFLKETWSPEDPDIDGTGNESIPVFGKVSTGVDSGSSPAPAESNPGQDIYTRIAEETGEDRAIVKAAAHGILYGGSASPEGVIFRTREPARQVLGQSKEELRLMRDAAARGIPIASAEEITAGVIRTVEGFAELNNAIQCVEAEASDRAAFAERPAVEEAAPSGESTKAILDSLLASLTEPDGNGDNSTSE